MFQHTAARRRLPTDSIMSILDGTFQHTAARRRLHGTVYVLAKQGNVSTHSRAEAAARVRDVQPLFFIFVSTHSRAEAAAKAAWAKVVEFAGFNTQPRGGGCSSVPATNCSTAMFQHTAARRRLQARMAFSSSPSLFQHTAARRRLQVTNC